MLKNKIEELIELLKKNNLKIAFAESCTGGMLASSFCSVPGVSKVFEFSAVTYSNHFKEKLLGVTSEILKQSGAVSLECVREMALGIISYCDCDMSISVSGIAGPDGGTEDKPVGTVWIACAKKDEEYSVNKFVFQGSRDEIRQQAVLEAINSGIRFLKPKPAFLTDKL